MNIRPAEERDTAALAHLMRLLGYPTNPGEMGERLEGILRSPSYYTVVADIDGEVVGMAGAMVGRYYERNGVYGRILALVVDENARGHGVGQALIEQVESWLLRQKVTAIYINSGSHRTEAHEFYVRRGYRQTGLRFAKDFAPQASA